MKSLPACILFSLLFSPAFFQSCTKSEEAMKGESHFEVYLTDDPGEYEEVWIDVQDIQVNFSNADDAGWQSLDGVSKGKYDLLTLVNNNDTLLADADIPSGRLHQLRLVLGPDNYVKVNGSLIKMNTPAAQQAGLKLNIRQDIANGLLYKIILDFDVAKSVVGIGNGNYDLKPVIRTVFETVGGAIRGWVKPKDFRTAVSAIQGTDTVTGSFTGADGGFIIKGIAEGTYSLFLNPADTTYNDSLIAGIPVMNKEVIVLDTVRLQQ